jgi:hypothetical protein
MRNFSVEQIFEFSLEELFLARETRYGLERPWPEVRKVKVNSKEETGQKLHIDRMLFIDPGLPEFISLTLGSPVLKIHEVLTYKKDEGTFKVVVELQFSKSIVDFQEVTYHNSITDNKSSRRIEASVHSPIPLLGSKLEKMLEDEFKGQSEKDYNRLIKIMQANE